MSLPPTLGPLRIAAEVNEALASGLPVVALESSIIAQGFPAPDNLRVGQAMERAVRETGAIPATVGVLDGAVRVGLDAAEMAAIADGPSLKCSARDLAFAVVGGGRGGTTVAATAQIAAQAGIPVFATGGIGGVHRRFPGEEGGVDISADLIELGRRPIAVISAGAKSILDLPATLEALETHGVALVGYRCDEFPAFHTGESGLPLKHRVDELSHLAEVVATHLKLGSGGALLICNPPPAGIALKRADLDAWLKAALAEAEKKRVRGGQVTPFLLAALDRLSGGRTREVNFQLAVANARLGGELAMELRRLGSR